MGGDSFWEFKGAGGERGWGPRRLLSNLKAWLTTVSNVSVYQGL